MFSPLSFDQTLLWENTHLAQNFLKPRISTIDSKSCYRVRKWSGTHRLVIPQLQPGLVLHGPLAQVDG